jgi:hypothetical protein
VVPTLVIVSAAETCRDDQREHLGVVFYGLDPQAWGCLSDTEVAAFHAWGTATFPAVQIVTVTAPLPAINCPPPAANATLLATLREETRSALMAMAPCWFVPATPAAAAKKVA